MRAKPFGSAPLRMVLAQKKPVQNVFEGVFGQISRGSGDSRDIADKNADTRQAPGGFFVA